MWTFKRLFAAAATALFTTIAGAQPEAESLVGEWMCTLPVPPVAGLIYSFRDDGSARMLMPVDEADIAEMRRQPDKEERAAAEKSLLTLNGKHYINALGTWKKTGAHTISIAFNDPSGKKPPLVQNFTVNFQKKNWMQLMQPGAPLQFTYMGLPLPRQ